MAGPFGILAGMLHFTLVASVPLLHGGFCLYNGGFTAAFVCMFFIPIFEHFFRTKEEPQAGEGRAHGKFPIMLTGRPG